MDIGRTDGVGGPGRIDGIRPLARAAKAYGTEGPRGADQVSLSAKAELIGKALAMPSVRLDRVEEMKRLVESGRLETPERLEGAVKGFLAENPDVLS
jgi:hypothetical protein